LPHGFIFAGPSGVGRYLTATRLAAIFLTDRPDDPERVDESLGHILAETHPDFHRVHRSLVRDLEGRGANKATQLSIDVVREFVVAPASRKSVTGRGKVFVLEEAERMNPAAQNALLKTLEEPAGRSLIILLSESAGILLPTIRSRTQTVRFRNLAFDEAERIVIGAGVEPMLARLSVQVAGGSPGRAISFARDGVAMTFSNMVKLIEDRRPVQADALLELLKSGSETYSKKQLEIDSQASTDNLQRTGATIYLTLIADHLRKMLVRLEDDHQRESICQKIDALRQAEADLLGNVQFSLVLRQIAVALVR
jgi:DNA polymerase-3 subunit delta'